MISKRPVPSRCGTSGSEESVSAGPRGCCQPTSRLCAGLGVVWDVRKGRADDDQSPGMSGLIWPADDRSSMGSNTPRSVRAMGAINRTAVPITVTVRICLANSYSPVGTDASSSIDAIGTSGCAARLREHERSKCDHDGEHRCAISGKA